MALAMVNANHPNFEVAVAVKRDGMSAAVELTASIQTAFMHLFGHKTMNVTRVAEATVAEFKYEIALSLDTTGSMEGTKLSSMKTAAAMLITDLDAQVDKAENLKFSLVPFATFVNVGPGFGPEISGGSVTRQPAPWLDSLGQSPISQSDLATGVSRFALFSHLGHAWKGCVESRPAVDGVDYATTDTEPASNKPHTLFSPAFAADEPSTFSYGGQSYKYANSYLGDNPSTIGQNNWDKRRVRYGVTYSQMPTTLSGWATSTTTWTKVSQDNSASQLYSNYKASKGPNFFCETQPITPLTYDYTSVNSAITNLIASGNTNILEGIAWGWRTLSHGAPFTEGRPSSDKSVRKILILLTDGENFLGHVPSGLGSGNTSFGFLKDGRLDGLIVGATAAQTTDALNQKTLDTCENIKQSNIEVFTILLDVNDDATSSLLRECASKPENFINVPEPAGLKSAFAKIKTGIVSTRLSN